MLIGQLEGVDRISLSVNSQYKIPRTSSDVHTCMQFAQPATVVTTSTGGTVAMMVPSGYHPA
jgi:hypothetical protein